jgi:general secretion pathway protein C
MWQALKGRWLSLAGEIKSRSDGRRDWAALLARAPPAVGLTLGLAIAAQVVTLTFDLLNETGVTSRAGAGNTGFGRGEPRNSKPLAVLNTISAAHLFGEAAIAMSARRATVSRAPLVLTGTIATGDPAEGYALIGTSATRTHVFHTGSLAAPGIRLIEVYPQRVVLVKGEERMVLVLPHGSLGDQAGSVQFAGARGAPLEAMSPDEGATEAPAAPEDFKPPPISNGATIIRAFALRPVSIGGQRGVRIMNTGLNAKTLSDLGLAPGDVITAINGMPVGDPKTPDLTKAIQQGSASLLVDRNGEQTSVTIDRSSAAYAARAYNQQESDN